MSFLPNIKPAKLLPILVRIGFRVVRQKGSHITLEHITDKKKITVPMHNKDLPKPTLFSILKQSGISIEEFLKLLGKK